MLSKRSHTTLFILCFLQVTCALIIAWSKPAITYESSLYASTPILTWIFLILPYLIGIIYLIYTIFSNNRSNRVLVISSILLLSIIYTSILSMFIIRNYYLWEVTGDPGEHVGYVEDALNGGHVPSTLIYPIVHIFATQIILLTGLSTFEVTNRFLLIFELFFLLSMYLVSRAVLVEKNQKIVAFLLATTFSLGFYLNFTPNHSYVQYFPIALYLTVMSFKSTDLRWKLLLLILLVLSPPFHMVPTIIIGMVISIYMLFSTHAVFGTNSPKNMICGTLPQSIKLQNYLIVVLFLAIVISWLMQFWIFSTVSNLLYDSIFGGAESFKLSQMTDRMDYASSYGYNVYEYILKMKLGVLLLYSCCFISFIFFVKEYWNDNRFFVLKVLYVIFFALGLFIATLQFINVGFGPLRFLAFISMLSLILVSVLVTPITSMLRDLGTVKKAAVALGIVLYIFSIFIANFLILYPSPYSLMLSPHTTRGEYDGMGWYFNNLDDYDVIVIANPIYGYLYAQKTSPERDYLISAFKSNQNVKLAPNHFGYDGGTDNLGNYVNGSYMLLSNRDIALYSDVYPEIAKYRFFESDFSQLSNDTTVYKYYSNGDFTVYYIA